MKILLSLLINLTLIVLVVGCGKDSKSDEGPKVTQAPSFKHFSIVGRECLEFNDSYTTMLNDYEEGSCPSERDYNVDGVSGSGQKVASCYYPSMGMIKYNYYAPQSVVDSKSVVESAQDDCDGEFELLDVL
ncbi:hypothetical protein [Pseudobacteriovorax antillogorgiicola]|uniref:Lipoprotein n=1 Tax=Pseudobacteriovorax antillogorgiicola TaxID=1513793 RepID=A0A1Y6C6A8_9BACT|nr:hypothetical protein [Pseudobacteriovorax antillogorgiicola]TCS49350.1 hypothetical protein EDD56_11530 [Pseudobacteriovorax antillogorgiicola]SMF47632.1 hypothetical protein SAMN06296036_114154 [Pseudobacteriovorax antillogorgiicola]